MQFRHETPGDSQGTDKDQPQHRLTKASLTNRPGKISHGEAGFTQLENGWWIMGWLAISMILMTGWDD